MFGLLFVYYFESKFEIFIGCIIHPLIYPLKNSSKDIGFKWDKKFKYKPVQEYPTKLRKTEWSSVLIGSHSLLRIKL
jgi:hypothetical protein